jgi:hypothetical protein
MFQTSEAPGGALVSRSSLARVCDASEVPASRQGRSGLALPCPAVPGRFCGSAGRIGEHNMAAGHQPGRCPNVGGGLRTATKRQAGLCPATPSGGPKAPPTPLRGFLVLSRSFEVARDSLQVPPGLALPAIAPPSPRLVVVRLWRASSLWRLLPALSAGRFARPGGRRPHVRNRWSCRAVISKQRVGSDQPDLSDLSDGFPAAA